MNKFTNLKDIKLLYDKGVNIIEHLKKESGLDRANLEHILVSYDLQAGSYIDFVEKNKTYVNDYTSELSKVINEQGIFKSIMEVGVGEATTLANLLPKVKSNFESIYGIDISWSRLRYGNKYLGMKDQKGVDLFVSDLFNIALPDNSIDVIYTSHSIEPNGGREKEALEALYRVTAKYLVLLEPSYNFGNNRVKSRMDKHGYVKSLYKTAIELGYNVVEYRLFEHCVNALNPTELIVIRKEALTVTPHFICPITKHPLILSENEYFSIEGLFLYPVISDIPFLLSENAIMASKYTDFL